MNIYSVFTLLLLYVLCIYSVVNMLLVTFPPLSLSLSLLSPTCNHTAWRVGRMFSAVSCVCLVCSVCGVMKCVMMCTSIALARLWREATQQTQTKNR